MTVTLTVEQRLNLMVLLRMTGRGKRKGNDPKTDNRLLCRRILKLVEIPKDELRKYEQSTPRGAWRDQEAVDASAEITIDLEDTLADKLLRVIDAFENWGPDDDDWLDPLVEQLEPAGARL